MPQDAGVGRALEREREVTAVADAVRAAAAGEGSLVLVEGPAGAGKTTLLDIAADRGREDGCTPLHARGSELEAEFAFGVVRQLFERHVAALDEAARDEVLAGSAALARAPLGLSTPPGQDRDRTLASLHGLYWLTSNLASGGPLLVLVDDVQWADRQSVQWLQYMAGRLEDLPVAMVLGRRTGGAQAADVVEELATAPGAVVLRPSPLSLASVARLVSARLRHEADPAFARACAEATGGNPFLVEHLLEGLRAEGVEPVEAAAARITEVRLDDVTRAVTKRLRALGSDAPSLARAVALLDTTAAPLTTAAALAGLDLPRAAAALDALVDAGLMRAGNTIDFEHPLVRRAVYDAVPPAERTLAHRSAAEVLHAGHAPPEAVAAHLTEVWPAGDAWVVDRLVEAADVVAANGTPAAAVPYLQRALREPPGDERRGDVLYQLGRAEALAAVGSPAATLAAAAEHLPRRLRGKALSDRAAALAMNGDLTGALEGWAEAGKALEPFDPEAAREIVQTRLSLALIMPGTGAQAAAELARMEPPERADSAASAALLATMAARALFANEPRERVLALVERSLDGFALTDRVLGKLLAFAQAFWASLLSERVDLAEEHVTRALEHSRATGLALDFQHASSLLAALEFERGRLWEAEAHARAALAAPGEQTGVDVWAAALLVDPLVAAGQLDEAVDVMTTYDLWGERIGWVPHALPWLIRGRLHLALGRPRDAVADFRAHGERDRLTGRADQAHFPWRSALAEALVAAGEPGDGEPAALVEEELRLARSFGASREIGRALRTAAILATGARRRELLVASVEELRRSHTRLELCRSLTDLGAAVRRDGERVAARELLTEALDVATRCGAGGLAARAREELAAAGARPRRARAWGPEALTARERRVAELAAEGMTNREIAQAQFVTLKTIESQLASVYRKLGIRSRGELAQSLREAVPA
ncbi:MAG TPA: AAA family ATPase [Solirubrobacteraceae bacterium]